MSVDNEQGEILKLGDFELKDYLELRPRRRTVCSTCRNIMTYLGALMMFASFSDCHC